MVPTTSTEGIKAIQSYVKVTKAYTLARFDEKGSVCQTFFVLESISYKPFKQYRNTCLLIAAGSVEVLKWDKFMRIYEATPFILWEGKQEVNTSLIVTSSSLSSKVASDHQVVTETRWPRFDPRYMHRALNSVAVEPIASFVPAIVDEEILLPYQTISQ